MSVVTDARTILRPRTRLAQVEDRLVTATQRAASVTLTLQEASVLLTVLQTARRLARTVGSDDRETEQELRRQLRVAEQAWESAERRLHQLAREHSTAPMIAIEGNGTLLALAEETRRCRIARPRDATSRRRGEQPSRELPVATSELATATALDKRGVRPARW